MTAPDRTTATNGGAGLDPALDTFPKLLRKNVDRFPDKVAIREKERLCILRVRDDLLVLETMKWPDEIRVPEFEQLDRRTRYRINSVSCRLG